MGDSFVLFCSSCYLGPYVFVGKNYMTLVSRITLKQKAEMTKLRKTGLPLRKIGSMFGVHGSHVYYLTGGNWGTRTQSLYERKIDRTIECKQCGNIMLNDKWRLAQQEGRCFMCWHTLNKQKKEQNNSVHS